MSRKLKVLFQITLLLFILTSCGNKSIEQSVETEYSHASKTLINESVEGTQDLQKGAENNFSYEVSDVKNTVYYEGEEFQKSVFCTGGEMIYLCGKKQDSSYFLGSMKKEESNFSEIPMEIPKDMRVLNMAVDNLERCHILWVSVEKVIIGGEETDTLTFEQSYITVVSYEGDVEEIIDITEIFSTVHMRPFCFAIDDEGNYYLDNEQQILKLNPDGSLDALISCPGYVEAIGCGKSGTVFCIYADENGDEMPGKLEQDAIVPCGVILPRMNAIYGYIAAGTDTELLLYNKAGGVYTYDLQTNDVTQRIPEAELPVSGRDVSGYGFLGDGRLCLLSREDEKIVFYYIPAGK